MRARGSRIGLIVSVAAIVAGLAVLVWPKVADVISSHMMRTTISSMSSSTDGYDSAAAKEALRQAEAYNTALAGGTPDVDVLPYDQQLTFDSGEGGPMSWIEVPKISVNLPIYHHTQDDELAAGVGHLDTSSLPVGGGTAHCVVSAHSGAGENRLFDDIRQLEAGDLLCLHTLGGEYTYEVTGSEVVWPWQTDSLALQEGRDLCTLITCTPYGVNDHRLLVHAKRTDRSIADEEAKYSSPTPEALAAAAGDPRNMIPLAAGGASAAAIATAVAVGRHRSRHRRTRGRTRVGY